MRLNNLVANAITLVANSPGAINMRLMTYNIRYAISTPDIGEELWSVRKPLMSAQLNYEIAGRPESLLCFQEATYPQVTDLHSGLGEDTWAYVGVGRDDGAQGGEFAPIFYRPSVWKLEKNSTYWLGENPEMAGSIGWDAAYPRIVNVARFRHIRSGARFVYMCTHFDDVGQIARENSANFIVNLTDEWSTYRWKTLPVFLGGDLNVTPDNKAYQTLASELHDIKDIIPKERQFGNTNTFTGFTVDTSNDTEIDHIFVKDPKGLLWDSFAVLNTRYDNGVFISDHRPVVVDFKMSGWQ